MALLLSVNKLLLHSATVHPPVLQSTLILFLIMYILPTLITLIVFYHLLPSLNYMIDLVINLSFLHSTSLLFKQKSLPSSVTYRSLSHALRHLFASFNFLIDNLISSNDIKFTLLELQTKLIELNKHI